MNTTAFRRFGAIAASAAIASTIHIAGATHPAAAGPQSSTEDRPCFMIRSHWNNAEGPQPTCPLPMWRHQASSPDTAGAAGPASRAIADFLP
jgi:hypothetical protein